MGKITLYTIDCPSCKVLEKKLNAKGVEYETIDCRTNNEKNITVFPQLEVDGTMKTFSEAVAWLKEM